MRHALKFFFLFSFFFFVSYQIAFAHTPRVIDTPLQNDVTPLSEPAVSQAIYGTLEGYPHMFEFYTKSAMRLHVEILVPDIETVRNDVSGIILRVNKNGSVTEISRLRAKEAGWEAFFEPWGGDSYRKGGSYDGDIEPGLYRVEASSPDNIGKYVLVVGTEERLLGSGYFALLSEMMKVKTFFGKPQFMIIESPLVYIPVVFLAGVLLLCLWVWRRRSSKGDAAEPRER